ncbi:hypothetical protein QEN19_003263 [Hanseniaspora menglaensis]
MFRHLLKASSLKFQGNLIAQPMVSKRLIFTSIPSITKPLLPTIGNAVTNKHTSLITELIKEHENTLIDLGLKKNEEENLLNLDSVLRKRRQKIRNHKMTKRRKDHRISINHKNDVKRQKRLNKEARENYELEHGLKFYKH